MSNIIEINIEIDTTEKIVYMGEENSSGVKERYTKIEDISKHIGNYIEMYHKQEIESKLNLINTKTEVEFIYQFLKEQNDTGYIDLEKLKILQDKKYVLPGDTPQDLQKVLDKMIEVLWEGLEDVPFKEENSIQYLDDEYLDFEVGKTTKEDIWHWFDDRYSKGVHHLLYEYNPENTQRIYYTEVDERIPEEKREDDLYYYECRTCEEEITIERSVTVDFSGTLITSEEILGDKEYIERTELFNDPKYEFLDDSDIYDRIAESLNNDLEEDNEM